MIVNISIKLRFQFELSEQARISVLDLEEYVTMLPGGESGTCGVHRQSHSLYMGIVD